MKHEGGIQRRDFLKLSSAAVLTGITGRLTPGKHADLLSDIEKAARQVGPLPRVKLGYSGRKVSMVIGSGDMAAEPREAGILCGMNYWHKANRWRNGAPESIIKNREAHYCQVTVDRVGPDHYRGHFDEDEHYAYVKKSLKETGLGYFDDMQLHYGYHNREELKNDRSFIRAFDRLKKEGLVKHLCLSQHSYAGSPRVENGESAAQILTDVIKDGLYEHAQFMYSFGPDPDLDEFLAFARTKNFGTIAMKTARGLGRMRDDKSFMKTLPKGIPPHNALARWLTTETKLDAVVIRVKTLDEFTETYSGIGRTLSAEGAGAVSMMTAYADNNACRLCGRCQAACPQHIPITEILRFERYAYDDHDWNRARTLYTHLGSPGGACIRCGTCMEACPINISIPDKIEKAHMLLC